MLPPEPAEPFVKLLFRFNENNTCLEKMTQLNDKMAKAKI
jgi:hypothetical protein